jgi:hypothetical protein
MEGPNGPDPTEAPQPHLQLRNGWAERVNDRSKIVRVYRLSTIPREGGGLGSHGTDTLPLFLAPILGLSCLESLEASEEAGPIVST